MDQLSIEDLRNIEETFKLAHEGVSYATLGGIADIQQHQEVIESALNGMEALITFYESKVREFQSFRDGAKDKKRVLLRDFDCLQRAYWTKRDEEKRAKI